MNTGLKLDSVTPPPIPKRYEARKWVIVAAVLGAIVYGSFPVCLRAFVVQPFRVPTNTMAPMIRGITKLPDGTSRVGDHIFVDKLSYRLRAPRRGEIKVFRTDGLKLVPGSTRGQCYAKRIVGLPGARVSIRPPFLSINDQRVTEPRISTVIAKRGHEYSGFLLPECFAAPKPNLCLESDSVQLGKDEYFVLGDNQSMSLDSRYWGAAPRGNIVGRATVIYWPPERAGISLTE